MINVAKATGRKVFQVRFISRSYRMRGSVARTQMKRVASAMVFIRSIAFDRIGIIPINSVLVISLINKMLVYSAIKISANLPFLYSTLKPDTSSDSPSVKSKGVREVSAKFVVNHVMNIGGSRKAAQVILDRFIMVKSIVI